MKTLVIAVVLLVGIVALFTFLRRPESNAVVLAAAPGNANVQMFDRIGATAIAKAQFSDGISCTKVSGPTETRIEGITMSFYQLTCNGVTGYINARYVHQ